MDASCSSDVLCCTAKCESNRDTEFGQLETENPDVNCKPSEEVSLFEGLSLPCEPACKHLGFLPDADEDDVTGTDNRPTRPWRQSLKRKRDLSDDPGYSRKRQKLL